MSWCDKLASTPTIGLKFSPSFVPTEQILGSIKPILDRFMDGDRPTFSIEKVDPFSVVINSDEGYRYSFDSLSHTVAFNHRVRAKPSSAGPPTMELISKPAPYTDLLQEVKERLCKASGYTPGFKQRTLRRLGVVSLTQVELDDAPPGIQSLIADITKPFGGPLENMNLAVATSIRSDEKVADRCIHTIVVPEDESELVTLQFDWQRQYVSPITLANANVEKLVEQGLSEALSYFERVAEGGLSDACDSGS